MANVAHARRVLRDSLSPPAAGVACRPQRGPAPSRAPNGRSSPPNWAATPFGPRAAGLRIRQPG